MGTFLHGHIGQLPEVQGWCPALESCMTLPYFNAISKHQNQTKNRQLLNLSISMTKHYRSKHNGMYTYKRKETYFFLKNLMVDGLYLFFFCFQFFFFVS